MTTADPAATSSTTRQPGCLVHYIASAAAWLWRWNGDQAGQRPLRGRFTAHLALLFVAMLLPLLGSMHWNSVVIFASEAAEIALLQTTNDEAATNGQTPRLSYMINNRAAIARRADPHTSIPDRPRLEIVTYTVQPGDTTQSIAEQFGLQPTTLMWSNREIERAPDLLRVGQQLIILPLDGAYHTVEEDDTLESLAEKYSVTVEAITACPFNTLPTDGTLAVGAPLIIPDGTKPYTPRTVTAYSGPIPESVQAAGVFRWPTSGYVSQSYWYGHRAIDIANDVGTAVVSADGGYVSFAGWTDVGYGYLIVVDHDNGYQTYYAHLSNIFVIEGQAVTAGQVLGAMGSTGNSTGPHLHFEIRYNQYPTNPLIYLP